MKKGIFFIILLLLSFSVYADDFINLKVNDVIISYPKESELFEFKNMKRYFVKSKERLITYTIYTDDKIKIKNLNALKAFHKHFIKGAMKNFKSYNKVELIYNNFKDYNNIKISETKINVDDLMTFESITFYLDNTIYSIIYQDNIQNDVTKIEKEKIFNSIKFENPKTINNQLTKNRKNSKINYYQIIHKIIRSKFFYLFCGIIILNILIIVFHKKLKL